MGERVSEVIILCEDDPQARLIRAYLEICGRHGKVRSKVASRERHGGNVGWVTEQFPFELHACRQRNKLAKTLLIVMVDADDNTIDQRRQNLSDQVTKANLDAYHDGDPLVLLIAKRNVETWISNALGNVVNEQDDYKTRKEPGKSQCRIAARAIHEWSRDNANYPSSLVPSLRGALPQWKAIC